MSASSPSSYQLATFLDVTLPSIPALLGRVVDDRPAEALIEQTTQKAKKNEKKEKKECLDITSSGFVHNCCTVEPQNEDTTSGSVCSSKATAAAVVAAAVPSSASATELIPVSYSQAQSAGVELETRMYTLVTSPMSPLCINERCTCRIAAMRRRSTPTNSPRNGVISNTSLHASSRTSDSATMSRLSDALSRLEEEEDQRNHSARFLMRQREWACSAPPSTPPPSPSTKATAVARLSHGMVACERTDITGAADTIHRSLAGFSLHLPSSRASCHPPPSSSSYPSSLSSPPLSPSFILASSHHQLPYTLALMAARQEWLLLAERRGHSLASVILPRHAPTESPDAHDNRRGVGILHFMRQLSHTHPATSIGPSTRAPGN